MAGKYKTNRFYWNAPQRKERPEHSGAGIWQKQYYSLLFVRHSKDGVGETEYQKIHMYKQVHKSQQAVKFRSQKVCKVHCAITIITVLWFSNHCLTSTTTLYTNVYNGSVSLPPISSLQTAATLFIPYITALTVLTSSKTSQG